MNTFLSRANSIFAFTLSVMAGLTFSCFLTTAFNAHQTDVNIKIGRAAVKNVPDYSAGRSKNDLGFITFDLQSVYVYRYFHEHSKDVTNIFNWNVKQLFLYLTAEYETSDHMLNQVVVWDKIILRGENSYLDFKNANTKYYFWDYGNGLKGNKNITLTLSWNVIPNAGTLPKIKGSGFHTFQFPEEYSTSRF